MVENKAVYIFIPASHDYPGMLGYLANKYELARVWQLEEDKQSKFLAVSSSPFHNLSSQLLVKKTCLFLEFKVIIYK